MLRLLCRCTHVLSVCPRIPRPGGARRRGAHGPIRWWPTPRLHRRRSAPTCCRPTGVVARGYPWPTRESTVRREAVRLQAAEWVDQDVAVSEIAKRLRVSDNAVCRWRRQWHAGGESGLASKDSSGADCRLSPEQQDQLAAALREGPAAHGWVEDQRWTLARVADLIAQLFGVRHTQRGVSFLLHRLGFRPQVPTHRPIDRTKRRSPRGGKRRGCRQKLAVERGVWIWFEDEASPQTQRRTEQLRRTDYAVLLGAAHRYLKVDLVVIWGNPNTHISAAMRHLIANRSWLHVIRLPAPRTGPQSHRKCLVPRQTQPGQPRCHRRRPQCHASSPCGKLRSSGHGMASRTSFGPTYGRVWASLPDLRGFAQE